MASPPPLASEPSPPPTAREAYLASLRAGNYRVINSLVRLVPDGLEAKTRCDAAIDLCEAMQNLRWVARHVPRA